MTDWDNPWPELQGLTELERYELVQAAKKRIYAEPLGYVRVLAVGALMVGLVLVVILVVRMFSDSVWSYALSSMVGLFLAMQIFDRWYHARLRRAVRVIIDDKNRASGLKSGKDH